MALAFFLKEYASLSPAEGQLAGPCASRQSQGDRAPIVLEGLSSSAGAVEGQASLRVTGSGVSSFAITGRDLAETRMAIVVQRQAV